jgi:hypothetical protein
VQSVDEMVKGIRNSDAFTNSSKYSLDGYNYVPTRAEKKRWVSEWEKAQRFSQGGTTKELTEKVKVEVSCATRLQTPPGRSGGCVCALIFRFCLRDCLRAPPLTGGPGIERGEAVVSGGRLQKPQGGSVKRRLAVSLRVARRQRASCP